MAILCLPPKAVILFLNTSFILLLSFYLYSQYYHTHQSYNTITNAPIGDCSGLHKHPDNEYKCAYIKSHSSCQPKGYINYLQIFYCTCGQFPILGYTSLALWLVLLFYVLGNTAANYFCSSLESLSKVLNLSPTIAGVTLLALGNGAADVFASIVSFEGPATVDVGLNSIVGGSFFVSSAVLGIISVLVSPREISVDKKSFIRDVVFFIFSISFLVVIIVVGRISLWVSICFVSVYLIYVFVVSATLFFGKKDKLTNLFEEGAGVPLLGCVDEDEEKSNFVDETDNSSIYDDRVNYTMRILSVMELPLYLPRRLTIPVVSQDKWSKPFAVVSVTLAPLFLAEIWSSQKRNMELKYKLVIYMISGMFGICLGNVAYVTTNKSSPPKKCLLPWLVGGFLMSVTWTYVAAEELISLLVSLGNILEISPSVLGLTVLAWGNSLSDLIANVAMATTGGPDGVQIAIAGCYAGPMFNTLVGLGLSFVFSSWASYPSSYDIPKDTSLYETLGFFMGGLLWALVILPRKNMKLDKFLGFGLLAIYLCFLFLRMARALGVHVDGTLEV